MSKFYEDLKEGLEEILEFTKGKITLKSETIEIPEAPAEYKAKDIKRIRNKGPYSQGVFAKILNVSPRTVQSWETGQRIPSHSSLRLLELVDKDIFPLKQQRRPRI